MKQVWLVILLFLSPIARANEKDSVFVRLNRAMDDKEYYVLHKEQDIENLKQLLVIGSLSPWQKYEINRKLYEEYVKYQTDSAVYYILKNQEIAYAVGKEELQQESAIRLAGLYATKGMYIESKELLDGIDSQAIPRRLLPIYYETCTEFYSHYGQSNGNAAHYRKSDEYRDSLLLALEPTSLPYRIADAARRLFRHDDAVDQELLTLLQQTSDQDPERAVIAFLLGTYYKNKKEVEQQMHYFAISAITDIVNCIRDNASLNSLALSYYALGDVNRAYRFFQAAMDDAVFCNVRYRASEAVMSYPVINEQYHAQEKVQKGRLQFFLVAVVVLLLVLIWGISYIYLQMKRLSHIRKELHRTNQKLIELNQKLTAANSQLQDSNRIKEEYIAHFFDLCSTYINKIGSYRKALNKYAANNQIEKLVQALRSNKLIDSELEDLYHKFDSIFLSLYPTFVEEYRALQLSGEPIILKEGELLNTELRIFALVRLGITDSVKIAEFLRYSISTIYNYRVRARNNATVARERFEERVMGIGEDGGNL